MFEPVNQSETVVDGVKKTRQKSRPAGPHEIEPCCIAAASPEKKNKKMKAKSMVRRKCQEKDRTGQHNDEFSSEDSRVYMLCAVRVLRCDLGCPRRVGRTEWSSASTPERSSENSVKKKMVDAGIKQGMGWKKKRGKRACHWCIIISRAIMDCGGNSLLLTYLKILVFTPFIPASDE